MTLAELIAELIKNTDQDQDNYKVVMSDGLELTRIEIDHDSEQVILSDFESDVN